MSADESLTRDGAAAEAGVSVPAHINHLLEALKDRNTHPMLLEVLSLLDERSRVLSDQMNHLSGAVIDQGQTLARLQEALTHTNSTLIDTRHHLLRLSTTNAGEPLTESGTTPTSGSTCGEDERKRAEISEEYAKEVWGHSLTNAITYIEENTTSSDLMSYDIKSLKELRDWLK